MRRSARAGLALGALGTTLSLIIALLLAFGVVGLSGLAGSADEEAGDEPGAGGGSEAQKEDLERRNEQLRRDLEERAARQRQELEERNARQRDELRRRSEGGR